MKTGLAGVVVAVFLLSSAQVLFAVEPPEPQSGGTYFFAKGTKSAEDYRTEGRTGARYVDEEYYGKGINVDPLIIKPMIGYAGEFDSNVFLEDDDTDQDYINRLVWGVDADLPFNYKGEHRLIGLYVVRNFWTWNRDLSLRFEPGLGRG